MLFFHGTRMNKNYLLKDYYCSHDTVIVISEYMKGYFCQIKLRKNENVKGNIFQRVQKKNAFKHRITFYW